MVAPSVGSMPGRAVGEGVRVRSMGVAVASGAAGAPGVAAVPGAAVAPGVAVAPDTPAPVVLAGAAALPFAADRVGCAAAVIAEGPNGRVQVGTGVRLGCATGGEDWHALETTRVTTSVRINRWRFIAEYFSLDSNLGMGSQYCRERLILLTLPT